MVSERNRRKVKYLIAGLLLIHAYNSQRNRTKLHRVALVAPHESPWNRLYLYGVASSFLTMTGLSREAFTLLHDVLFANEQPQRLGRPQMMTSTAQLGLYLFFIGSTMRIKHLCLIFGVTPTVCSKVINKMLELVVQNLRRHPLARVQFPT